MSVLRDTIQDFFDRHRIAVVLLAGLLLGGLAGVALSQYVLPVSFINATPHMFRSDFRNQYYLFVARQYTGSGNLAEAHLQLVGNDAAGDVSTVVSQLENQAADIGGEDSLRLQALARDLRVAYPVSAAESSTAGSSNAIMTSALQVCLVGVGVLAVVALGTSLVRRLRGTRAEEEAVGMPVAGSAEGLPGWGSDGLPIGQFPTTYTLGEDNYDPSFSIEPEDGEFLGECGVGISETIGVGTPNKVTAFEIWLFDKNDIRTVTKVLMSDYAFHDGALRAKLAPKGEAVLAQEGEEVVLETKSLRVCARIIEARYGESNLPPDSFFERVTIELVAWPRLPSEEGVGLDEFVLSSLD